jgi:hypothetical protein
VWSEYTFDNTARTTSGPQGRGSERALLVYQRDPVTFAVSSLTLTCTDRTGCPLRHFSLVRDNEKWIKRDLMQTRCSLKTRRQLGSL